MLLYGAEGRVASAYGPQSAFYQGVVPVDRFFEDVVASVVDGKNAVVVPVDVFGFERISMRDDEDVVVNRGQEGHHGGMRAFNGFCDQDAEFIFFFCVVRDDSGGQYGFLQPNFLSVVCRKRVAGQYEPVYYFIGIFHFVFDRLDQ